MGDSTSAGFVNEISPQIPYDDDLLDLLQPIFAGVLGPLISDPSLIRPRWQMNDQPTQPEYNINWVAIGISTTRTDVNAYETHVAEGLGYDLVEETEEIDVLASFYGPKAANNCGSFSNGIRLEQNRRPLNALNIELIQVRDPVTLPALVTGKWLKRVDVTITLRRYASRQYGIRTIVESDQSVIDNEQYLTPITVPTSVA